jgi:hypothetical protein
VALATLAGAAPDPLPDAARLLGWVRDLAAPAMEGRASGTAGADRAAAYLADHFKRVGLRPLGDGGSYLQRFTVLTRVRLGSGNTLEIAGAGPVPRTLAAATDFLPFTFSDDGEVTGEAVFAGYGITAPPLGYDDYAGLDARGKVVLVMTGEPRESDPQGPFRRPEHFHYTELRHKVLNAREHGAAAVIVVETTTSAETIRSIAYASTAPPPSSWSRVPCTPRTRPTRSAARRRRGGSSPSARPAASGTRSWRRRGRTWPPARPRSTGRSRPARSRCRA